MLLTHFTNGTEKTTTGSQIGIEIETHFRNEDGSPISIETADAILRARKGRPKQCQQKLELGRQNIEIAVAPQPTIQQLLEVTMNSLSWLYKTCAGHGAFPRFAPEITWKGDLLWVQEQRDEIWVELDGRSALEHLCRISAVQFTIDMHPEDAIAAVNALWKAQLHTVDYDVNDRLYRRYVAESRADYRPDRFGGPEGFDSLSHYVAELEKHKVVMHNDKPIRAHVRDVVDLDIELFLRSIWWHYRLRRYGDNLALEIRPFSRRHDANIVDIWQLISNTLKL